MSGAADHATREDVIVGRDIDGCTADCTVDCGRCKGQPFERAAREVALLREIVVFADGYVVASSRRNEPYTMGLADLYNETCDIAGALVRAGCHPRGRFADDRQDEHTRQDDNTCSCGSDSFEVCLRAVFSGR